MNVMKVRDTNQDGFMSKSDFELIIQRYKQLGASDKHLVKLDKSYNEFAKVLGIVDDNIKLTYEQCIGNYAEACVKSENLAGILSTHFEIIDSDGNGIISFKEWSDYYIALGIDSKYAKDSFESMDFNSDGVVSMEEFIAFNKEFYLTAEDKLHSSILFGPLD